MTEEEYKQARLERAHIQTKAALSASLKLATRRCFERATTNDDQLFYDLADLMTYLSNYIEVRS